MVGLVIMGTLRSNDADDDENGYGVKMLDFVFYGERRQATTKLYLVLFLFLSLDNGHLKFSLRRVRLHLRK